VSAALTSDSATAGPIVIRGPPVASVAGRGRVSRRGSASAAAAASAATGAWK
jgi:hypothetical protein